MSEKEVKSKPKTSPKTISKESVKKVAVKSKDVLKENAKDISSSMKDVAVKKLSDLRNSENTEPQKVDTEAAESIECSAYATTDAIYKDGKRYIQKKVKDHRKKAKEKKELEDDKDSEDGQDNKPEQKENEPKTKENYNKQNNESDIKEKEKADIKKKSDKNASVKTKEEYLKTKKAEATAKHKESSPESARRTYIEKKIRTKAEYEKNYAEEYRRTNLDRKKPKTKSISESSSRKKLNSANGKKIAGKNNGQKVKAGTSYTGKYAKKKTVKKTKTVVKTQKTVSKKAAKEASLQAKALAQKTALLAKKAAIAARQLAVKVAQAVAKVLQAIVSAIGAIAGGGVLIVLLVIVMIVAAIAASPFGIFFSDEAEDKESIPVSSIVNECNIELSKKLQEIEDNNDHDRVELIGEPADWSLVLSLFSVKLAGKDDDTAEDVVVIDESKKKKLKKVFWDMHTLTSKTKEESDGDSTITVLYITIETKTKEEMIEEYSFSKKQKEALETLLENAGSFQGATQSLAVSDSKAKNVIERLPDSISEGRKQVVKKACSLVGKVTYFWGGKSSAIGWDSNWGKMTRVTAEGSSSTGTIRPFGLDCSGFVTWAFHNAGYSESQIGHGAEVQATKGTRISWSDAQPGDLAVYNDKSHIGIVAGTDKDGNILIIHCASGKNNVVITKKSGFGYVVRPNFY